MPEEDILKELKDAYIDLASLISSKENEITIEERKDKVKNLSEQSMVITKEISEYLMYSIEDRCEKKYIEYLAFLCAEKLENANEDKWINIWSDFKIFEDDNSSLAQSAIEYMITLVMYMREPK